MSLISADREIFDSGNKPGGISRPGAQRHFAVAAATLLVVAMGWNIAGEVWRTGFFGDTDDALRMVQVRDLLAGQAWFDLRVHRLSPPDGVLIHWSRIVDVPLTLLIKFFSLLLATREAELAARYAFPLLLVVGLFQTVARAANELLGERGVTPAITLCALTGIGLGQFQPGRIDHHAPQIVLLMLMLAFTLESLKPQRHWLAAATGAAAALSLGISIENLPFILVASALYPAFWIVDGEDMRKPLFAYGCGLAMAIVVVACGTITPFQWRTPYCDALSIAYVLPTLLGAAGCMALGTIKSPIGKPRRGMFTALVGLATIAPAAFLFPHCFRGPLAGVDPLLKLYWLDNVHEARPLLASLQLSTKYTVLVMMPAILSAAFVLLPVFRSQNNERRSWIVAGSFIATGVAMTFWQIRAGSSLTPLSVLPGAWLVVKFREYLERQGVGTAQFLCLALALPLTSMGWALGYATLRIPKVATAGVHGDASQSSATAANCFASASYAEAAKLPPGLVAAPIDVGAHMLAFTGHKVLAAAYHRNNEGNRRAVDILFAEPARAEAGARAAGANYVAICMGEGELGLIRSFAPHGLASTLSQGTTPEWLQEVTAKGAHLRLFRVIGK